jgi:hypothetical protein
MAHVGSRTRDSIREFSVRRIGRTIVAALSACLALVVAKPAGAQVGDMITKLDHFWIENRSFSSGDGDVLDGCITPGSYKLLRFDIVTANVGNSNFFVGAPSSSDPRYTFSAGHGHFHLVDFNKYVVTNTFGYEQAPGYKQAFCLMDWEKWDPAAGNGQFTCSNQGVSPGWADRYWGHTYQPGEPGYPGTNAQPLDCQFINITGLADGNYVLIGETNYARVAQEANFSNNAQNINFAIAGNTVTVRPQFSSNFVLDLGGILTESVTVIAPSANRIHVFGVGTDKRLYMSWFDGVNWYGWAPLGGGTLQGAVSVASWGPKRLDIVARGTAGDVLHWWTPDLVGYGSESLGGSIAAPPTIVAPAVNRIQIVGIGSNGRIQFREYNNAWSNWSELTTNQFRAEPLAVVNPYPLQMVVLGRQLGTDNMLSVTRTKSLFGTSTATQNLGGVYSSAFTASTGWGPTRIDVFGRGLDNGLWQMARLGGSWSGPYNLGETGRLSSAPRAISWGPGRIDVFFHVNDQTAATVDEKFYDGSWQLKHWSTYATDPNLNENFLPAPFTFGENQIGLFKTFAGGGTHGHILY